VFIKKHYGPFLLHPITKIVVALIFAVYLAIGIYGMTQVQQGLRFEKLMLETDPVVAYIKKDYELFAGGIQTEIVFNNAPDLIQSVNRQSVELVVQEFERSEWVFGNRGTTFWMREYLKYQNESKSFVSDTKVFWVDGVFDWWSQFYQIWSRDIKWHDTEERIQAFRLRIGMVNGYRAELIRESAVAFRNIAAKYPEFNITTFFFRRQIADQMLVVLPNTLQNSIMALACMGGISFFFIPSFVCILWITVAIISIDVGVIGFMALWGVFLDPISMITIIMSIGFAEYYTAHITYGYATASMKLCDRDRTIDAIQRVAWPVFEGAISTTLGVLVLSAVDSYMIRAFFKITFLVIIFGVAHALIFMPVMFDTFMPTCYKLTFCRPDVVQNLIRDPNLPRKGRKIDEKTEIPTLNEPKIDDSQLK